MKSTEGVERKLKKSLGRWALRPYTLSRLFYLLVLASISAAPLSVQAAQAYFNEAHTGTITLTGGDGLQSQSINSLVDLGATSYRLESNPASATSFAAAATGNNANVTFYYTVGGVDYAIAGQVSRHDKNGNTSQAFYFYDPAAKKGYLIVRRGYESTYSPGNNVSTSSDFTSADLDTVATADAAVLSVGGASANEGSSLVHTVTMTSSATASKTYSFSISGGTATSGTDYNATPVFSNGVTYSAGQITVPAGVSSFTVTISALTDAINESTETYNLAVGGKTGVGSILNLTPTNITLAKTATAAVVTNGTITYTLTLTNTGQSTSGTSLTVKERLPSGVTSTAATAGSGVSSVSGCTGTGLLTCTVTLSSGLAQNGTAVFTITATAPASAGSITNYANVGATGGTPSDPPSSGSCPDSSCGSASTTVSTAANFTLTKTATGSVLTGGAITYTLTLKNTGQTTSGTSATVKERLPAGVTATSVSPGAGVNSVTGCTGTGLLTCAVTLSSGLVTNATATFTITATAPGSAGSITNYANVGASGGTPSDPPSSGSCPDSSCGSAATTVSTPANFTLTKTATGAVVTGGTITYTLTIKNTGQTTSGTSATVKEQLPSGVTATAATAGSGVSSVTGCTGTGLLTCAVTLSSGLAQNGTASFTITATAPGSAGSITNYANVGASGGTPSDPPSSGSCPDSSCGSAATTVSSPGQVGSISGVVSKRRAAATVALANVSVALYDDLGNLVTTTTTAADGTYTFSSLPTTATYKVVFDAPYIKAINANAAPPTNTSTPVVSGAQITSIPVAAGADYSQQNALVVDPSGVVYDSLTRAVVSGARVWIGQITGSVFTPVADADLDTTNGTVNGAATGADGVYTLYLTSNVVTATPSNFYLVVVPPGCSASAGWVSPYVVCPAGNAYAASTASGNSALIAQQGGVYTPNTGGTTDYIQSQSGAPSLGSSTTYYMGFSLSTSSNGVANNQIPLDSKTNLTLTKSVSPSVVPTGGQQVFTLTLGNAGAAVSGTSATVAELMPVGSVITAVTGTSGIAGNGVSCTYNSTPISLPYTVPSGGTPLLCAVTLNAGLAYNGTAAFTITANAPATAGSYTNYASVDASGGNSPATPGNTCTSAACASQAMTVNTPSNLTLAKSATASVLTGGAITYTLTVTNTGQTTFGSNGATLTVKDQLPSGVTAGTVTAVSGLSGVSCAGTGLLTCTLTLSGGIAQNGTASFTIAATAPGSSGAITNYASVNNNGTGAPSNPTSGSCPSGESCANATTTVSTPANLTLTKTATGTVVTGGTITYTLTIKNTGQTTSGTSATVKEQLPSGVTATAATAGSGVSSVTGCTGTGLLTCAVTLSSGLVTNATATFTITATAPGSAGSITNYANVGASGGTPSDPPSSGSCPDSSCGSAATTVNTPSNLTLAKSATASVLTSGAITYTLTVTNTGQTTFGNNGTTLTVKDQLPSGVTATAASVGSGVSAVSGCTGTGLLTCTLTLSAGIAQNGTAAFTITATAPASAGSITNYATVNPSGGTPSDPPNSGSCPDSSCGSAATTVSTPANLSTTKTLGGVTRSGVSVPLAGYQVRGGDVLTYTLTVSNSGGQSGSTLLTETLPANTSYSGVAQGWTLSGSNYTQTVTAAGNGSTTVSFTVTVGALVDGVTNVSNTVSSIAGTCGSCTVSTSTVPRLSVSKTAPASLMAGGTASYSVLIENKGGSATSGAVTVVDTLPAGLTFSAQTAGAPGLVCTASGQALTCTGTPNIAAGGNLTVTYSVAIAADASGTKVNGALLTALGGDPRTPANDASTPAAGTSTQGSDKLSAKSAQAVITSPALSTSKTLAAVTRNGVSVATGGYQARSGDVLRYDIVVSNSGGQSGSTLLTETLPANTSYSGVAQGWTLSGSNYTQTVTAAGNGSTTVSFTVTVGALVDGVTSVSNTVSSSAGTCGSCTVSTSTVPRLSVSKTAPASLMAGGIASYSVLIENKGGSATSGAVTVVDTLPAGLTFSSQTAGAPGLVCTASGQALTCTGTPNIAAGGNLTVTYSVAIAADASGTKVNGALLTALGGDPRTPANDASTPAAGTSTQGSDKLSAKSAQVVITSPALTITKTLSGVTRGGVSIPLAGYQVRGGDVLTYTIVVNNNGGQSGTTTLTENVPGNTSYSGTGEGWTLSGGRYSQSVMLGGNGTVSKTFTVTVGALVDGVTSVSNTVSSSAGTCGSCTVSTSTVPRLSVSKTAPASLMAGGTASYSVLIENKGGSATSGAVTVVDTLPAGLTFSSQTAGAPGLVCTASGQALTCTGTPNIAAGGNLTVTYSVAIAADASGTKVNGALLTALGGDPRTPANDASTPAAGTSTQGSDKLSAKSAQAVTSGALSITKSLLSINGDTTGALVKSGDVLVYTIAIRETSGKADMTTLLTETVPAVGRYTGSGEGWVSSGSLYNQSVTVRAGQTVTKTFTVTLGSLDSSVVSVSNTVSASVGTCVTCTVTTKALQVEQTQEKKVLVGTPHSPDPIPGCAVSGLTLTIAPQHGSVSIGADNTILYTPNPGYVGPDQYAYAVLCGQSLQVNVTEKVLVIDPAGVVYDAISRAPLSGAAVTLIGPSGAKVPDEFLDLTMGGRNGQITGSDGHYTLLLKTNAPSGIYQLQIRPPAGYRDAPSTSIPPAAALYTPGFGGGLEYIQKQAAAPALTDPVTYYLAFNLRTDGTSLSQISNGVAHNHIPLDPVLQPMPLLVTKTAGKRSVGAGDLVPYRISIRTQDGVGRALATVEDILPAGMSYVSGSGVVNGVHVEPTVRSGTVTWLNQVIPAKGAMTFDLILSVGAGVTQGNRTNVALVRGGDGTPISNRAEAVVTIGPDRLFDCTDVIGKVFDDRNGNGRQDRGEAGVANVRLATVNGLLINTDAEGRFHIACAALPNARIGSNFVLKLDPASLPTGFATTTENPASVRLTSGVMQRIDFGVSLVGAVIGISATDFDSEGRLLARRSDEILRELKAMNHNDGKMRVLYSAEAGEKVEGIRARQDVVEALIRGVLGKRELIDRDVSWAAAKVAP